MRELTPREELLSAEAARVAAMKAIKAMDRIQQQNTKQKPKNTDRFAQNTWGMLAICCMAVAVTFTLLPGSEKLADTLALAPVANFESPKIPPVTIVNEASSTIEALDRVAETTPEIWEVQNLPLPLPVDPLVTATVDKMAADEAVDESEAVETTADTPTDSKLGVDIGGSDRIEMLIKRYAALEKRAPTLFEGLAPVVQKDDTMQSNKNRLIAGPFKDAAELVKFCRSVRLQLTIECVAANYEGKSLNDS